MTLETTVHVCRVNCFNGIFEMMREKIAAT
jgi:hypothetical protein